MLISSLKAKEKGKIVPGDLVGNNFNSNGWILPNFDTSKTKSNFSVVDY